MERAACERVALATNLCKPSALVDGINPIPETLEGLAACATAELLESSVLAGNIVGSGTYSPICVIAALREELVAIYGVDNVAEAKVGAMR